MITTSETVINGGDYEHTLGITGVYGDGVRLRYEPMRVQDIFVPMLETRRFEACEFSLANYITLRGTGQHWLTAVPVFPNRAFRHGMAVTRRQSPLESLAQFAGKRIGVEDYSMTAAVWFRGILQDEYGVDPRAIRWVTRSKQRFALPVCANVETTDADLEDMLSDGSLDALLGLALRDNLLPPQERRLRPVLADPQSEEQAYYRRTSIYPIMHCVVIRNDALERNPALGAAIFEVYSGAKERAYRRQLGATLVPWGKNHWAQTFELFGGDPLPYGLAPDSLRVIGRLAQYLQQQGFVQEIPPVDLLFPLTAAG